MVLLIIYSGAKIYKLLLHTNKIKKIFDENTKNTNNADFFYSICAIGAPKKTVKRFPPDFILLFYHCLCSDAVINRDDIQAERQLDSCFAGMEDGLQSQQNAFRRINADDTAGVGGLYMKRTLRSPYLIGTGVFRVQVAGHTSATEVVGVVDPLACGAFRDDDRQLGYVAVRTGPSDEPVALLFGSDQGDGF